MKNEKTLQDRVQFIIGIISFIGTVILFVFLLGKDVQSSDSKSDNSIQKITETNKIIESISEDFVKVNNEILSIKIDNILNKKSSEENEQDLKDHKKSLEEIVKVVHEIDKNQESMYVLLNRINQDWKEYKAEMKEYIAREK